MDEDSVERTERVLLRKRRERWASLPGRVKHGITKGVERLRGIRKDILATALVAELPPVHVVDVGWVSPGNEGSIHGRCTAFEHNGHTEFGAEIAAPIVIHASDDALRGILLHEFSHCFHFCRHVLEAVARGEKIGNAISGDVFDDEWDRKVMDPADLWFSAADVAIFPYHHSDLLADCTDAVAIEWVAKGFPTVTPQTKWSIERVSIPESVANRVRQNPIGGSR